MKKCGKCNAEIDDNAAVCPYCGENSGQITPAEDQDRPLLDRMMKFLRYEHFGWKLVGIMLLIYTIVFIVGGLIVMICGVGLGALNIGRMANAPEQPGGVINFDPSAGFSFEIDQNGQISINNTPLPEGAAGRVNPNEISMIFVALFMAYGILFITMALLLYLPVAIINLKMLKKVEYYENTLYSDVSIARKRCTSVGMIVFAAFFNKIALIFIIINFVKTRKNAAAFDRIEAAQKGGKI